VLLTYFLAERLRASPKATSVLNKVAGVFLIGFGAKLALTRRARVRSQQPAPRLQFFPFSLLAYNNR